MNFLAAEAGAAATHGTSGEASGAAQAIPATASSLKVSSFPNGNQSLEFEEFIEVIKESCNDSETAENYLVFAFSMFDREK